MKLRFKPQSLVDLQSFVRHYEQAFFELYQDGGVWNERLIIESYRQSAQKLYLAVLEEIKIRLSKNKVLGRKPLTELRELDFYVGSRLVIVYFSEDAKTKTRFVESITIDRKPIIF